MRRRRTGIRVSVANYVCAIRLSAGVAFTILPWLPGEEPTPIVRVAHETCVDGFDPRELVFSRGQRAVVTMPTALDDRQERSRFSPN